MMWRSQGLWPLFMLALLVPVPVEAGDAGRRVQDKLKIIYHFMSHYVDWPDGLHLGREGHLHLCSLGQDEVSGELKFLQNASTRALRILISEDVDITKLSQCDVVYVADDSPYSVSRITRRISGKPVLTISSRKGFAQNGGMVELVRDHYETEGAPHQCVRFSVNATALRNAHLTMKRDVYDLAVQVYR